MLRRAECRRDQFQRRLRSAKCGTYLVPGCPGQARLAGGKSDKGLKCLQSWSAPACVVGRRPSVGFRIIASHLTSATDHLHSRLFIRHFSPYLLRSCFLAPLHGESPLNYSRTKQADLQSTLVATQTPLVTEIRATPIQRYSRPTKKAYPDIIHCCEELGLGYIISTAACLACLCSFEDDPNVGSRHTVSFGEGDKQHVATISQPRCKPGMAREQGRYGCLSRREHVSVPRQIQTGEESLQVRDKHSLVVSEAGG